MGKRQPPIREVTAIKHDSASRRNIPTAEMETLVDARETGSILAVERRNRDLDPQLVWRGKDEQDWSDLVVSAPPLYIQEKIHAKALLDDLIRRSGERRNEAGEKPADLFADFNGLPKNADRTDFYQHDQNWSNRMILGDSLQVMASLVEREGMRGSVQCIYLDPPYGIRFNSNFQWSTTNREVKDGNAAHITREPEQVRAFRDTWRDGIHSYLTYLRDRLTVARELLTPSGSIFVQIGDENVHRVRCLMDEVFGEKNAGDLILVKKKGGQKGRFPEAVNDYIVWYFKDKESAKARPLFEEFDDESEVSRDFRLVRLPSGVDTSIAAIAKKEGTGSLLSARPLQLERERGARLFKSENATSGGFRKNQSVKFEFRGRVFDPGIARGNCWKHTAIRNGGELSGMDRLAAANRLYVGRDQLGIVRYYSDFGLQPVTNWWDGFGGAPDQVYVVQTNERVVERCLLLATDPGDLVLDPTCGSGTTAVVAEQWGRRWITIDTSRVALALARARIVGASFPYYILADSREGQVKEAEASRSMPSSQPVFQNIRLGFVYERRPHVTSSAIANNAEIDAILERTTPILEQALADLNKNLARELAPWEVPPEADPTWSKAARDAHSKWLQIKAAREREIESSVAAHADFEYLYDRPFQDTKKVRVAGPFTVESLSPHRVLSVDENDELIDRVSEKSSGYNARLSFPQMVLENLRTAGVQQAHKEDRINFIALGPWPGTYVSGEGHYIERNGGATKRAAVVIGPEFGTVTRVDLVDAAKEAAEAGFDVLIACAFNYEAHTTEFTKLGKLPVLKARMNADLHMAEDLKNTGKGNLFVIFGEPDIDILPEKGGLVRVKVNGVDVFHPSTGEVRSDGPDGIACWFIDTDYDGESFFVRHAYFLGANDPYASLKTTLKAEIDADAWETLHRDTSRPFEKPKSGRIAVKVINHLGDEVMKVFRV